MKDMCFDRCRSNGAIVVVYVDVRYEDGHYHGDDDDDKVVVGGEHW